MENVTSQSLKDYPSLAALSKNQAAQIKAEETTLTKLATQNGGLTERINNITVQLKDSDRERTELVGQAVRGERSEGDIIKHRKKTENLKDEREAAKDLLGAVSLAETETAKGIESLRAELHKTRSKFWRLYANERRTQIPHELKVLIQEILVASAGGSAHGGCPNISILNDEFIMRLEEMAAIAERIRGEQGLA